MQTTGRSWLATLGRAARRSRLLHVRRRLSRLPPRMTQSYILRAQYRYRCVMSISADDRLANLLGAVATGIDDAVIGALTSDGLDATTATALVALLDFSPAGSVERLRHG